MMTYEIVKLMKQKEHTLLINYRTLACSVGTWEVAKTSMKWCPSYTWNFKEEIDLATFLAFMESTESCFLIEIEY